MSRRDLTPIERLLSAGAGSRRTRTPAAVDPAAEDAPLWRLLRRFFAVDVLACTCGGRLRFLATIQDPVVVQRMLRHVGLPTDTPEPAAARPPPDPTASLAFDSPA